MHEVLIVDDDPAIRALVREVLDDDGYRTVGVQNGREALHALDVSCPACILLDLDMPLLDGAGFLRALAQRAERPPVLVMTADSRGRTFGPADGVVGQIPKPFDLNHLAAAVALATQVG